MDNPAMPPQNPGPRWGARRVMILIAVTAVVTALVAFGVTALLINIFERKQEARNPFFRVVELSDTEGDPAVWGKNFPLQYDMYQRTVDQKRTRYGGSEAKQRTPSDADPRSIVAQSRLEEDPRLKRMWAGYAFAVDFREERGHAYMLDDQVFTERQHAAKQPGTCIHCHASAYLPYKLAGNGDLIEGFKKLNPLPYMETKAEMERLLGEQNQSLHPVACIDCHDPANMALRVTRPGFLLGIQALANSDAPVPTMPSVERWRQGDRAKPYDPNVNASRQELRSFVCGQCHVEYYFKGPEKMLTYPWHKGQKADQILAYYEETGFKDFTHAETGAPALKAQHPEFEMWNQGIHARSGVACADCHMPYTRQGAMKVSDHWVRSPLLNVNNACQTCHKFDEEEMRQRAFIIQDRTFQMRNQAMDALVELIDAIKRGTGAGTPEDRLNAARGFQRRAQFLLDFIEAENSMGFHAPQEAARILFLSMNNSRQGMMALAGQPATVPTSPAEAAASAGAPPAPAGMAPAPAPVSAQAPEAGAAGASPASTADPATTATAPAQPQ